MPIFKTTVVTTVYHEAASLAEAQNDVNGRDVESILGEMHDGLYIGQSHIGETREVPADQVRGELITIGNDGSFFDFATSGDEAEGE